MRSGISGYLFYSRVFSGISGIFGYFRVFRVSTGINGYQRVFTGILYIISLSCPWLKLNMENLNDRKFSSSSLARAAKESNSAGSRPFLRLWILILAK